jgi:EmrB/QacA subfamily drug resistance transporter
MAKSSYVLVATLMIAAFTIGTDFTGVLLLVPAIEDEFLADITTTQWVLNIYAMSFAMFMVAGGRLGDMHGHRRIILIGLAIFVAASLACFLSPSLSWLICGRAVQGIGAAMMWPCILAFGSRLAEDDEKGLMMGFIMAGVTSGNVIGPLISGVSVSLGEWRLFFLINTLLSVLATILVMRFLPKDPTHDLQERVDYTGILVLSSAILALLYALDVGADMGWLAPTILGLFALSFTLFVLFPLVEARVRDPSVPPQLMHNREFMLTLWTNAFNVPAIFISFLYFPQYLQKVMGWTVLQASFGMLPLMVLLAVGSIIAGNFYATYGPKRLIFLGYVLILLGSASVILIEPSWGYFAILPAQILIGIGATLSVSPAGTATVSAVKPARAGLAGGLGFMFHLACGAIGVAVATAIMFGSSLLAIGKSLVEAGIEMSPVDVRAINGGALNSQATRKVLADYDAKDLAGIHGAITDGFIHGLSQAYIVALVCAAIGIFIVLAIDEKKLRKVEL